MKNLICKSKIFLCAILMLNLCISSICLANDSTSSDQKNSSQKNCIFHSIGEEDKFYIDADNIRFISNKIYISVSGSLIPIEHLGSDDQGIFVSIEEIETGARRQQVWVCPKSTCGYENYEGIDYCALCGTYRYSKRK